MSALVASAGLAACQSGPPPRSISVEVPEQVFGGEAARAIVTVVDANGNRGTSDADFDFQVEPPDLAKVDKKGFVNCQKSGDGKLNLEIRGVAGSARLSCRMVDKIEIDDIGRVDIGDGPFQPEARIMDKAGKELPDVKLTYSPKISSAVKARVAARPGWCGTDGGRGQRGPRQHHLQGGSRAPLETGSVADEQ